MNEYMSGDELYRFLHISKRKMKYLIDNKYIPTTDTGRKTHRYLVRRCDAEAFRERMTSDPDFLAELSGKFSSNAVSSIDKVIADFTISDSERFGRFLTEKWAKYPDAIPVQDAAKLMSCQPIRLYNLIESGKLFGAKVWNVTYCSKASLITYASSLTAVKRSKSKGYMKLIQEFAKKEIK